MRGSGKFLFVLRSAVAAWLFAELMVPGLAVYGSEVVPTPQQFAAFDRASDCGTYRRVAEQAKTDISKNKQTMDAVRDLLKQRRVELENCARGQGIQAVQTESQDEVLADACAVQYKAWLAPGYRFYMLKVDNQE